ncbi:MAG TPA: hypothetical protein VN922_07090 [Bacteroidia bacterium]|nr:hypothetical protein [Bacteroidia bacterium]
MKKHLFILFTVSFSLFTSLYCSAQADTSKKVTGYLSLGYGISQPEGNYLATTVNANSGYAKTGGAANLSFGIIINSVNFGFAFMRGSNINFYNINGYMSSLQAANPSSVYTAAYGKQSYLCDYAFYGVYKAFYYNRFSFDVSVLAGNCSLTFPFISYGIVTQGVPSAEYVKGGIASAVGFDGKLGIRYSVTKGFCVSVIVDYIYTDISFSTAENYTDNSGNVHAFPLIWDLPMSVLNISLNAGWQFGRNVK